MFCSQGNRFLLQRQCKVGSQRARPAMNWIRKRENFDPLSSNHLLIVRTTQAAEIGSQSEFANSTYMVNTLRNRISQSMKLKMEHMAPSRRDMLCARKITLRGFSRHLKCGQVIIDVYSTTGTITIPTLINIMPQVNMMSEVGLFHGFRLSTLTFILRSDFCAKKRNANKTIQVSRRRRLQ